MPPGRRIPLRDLHDVLGVEDLHVAHLSPVVDSDYSLNWSLALARGMDHSEGALWSGHANDALRVPGALLVATHTGGVWLLADGAPPVNVGHGWGQPDVNCLVRGPSDHHVLSVGRGIYTSDWTTTSLRWWKAVPIPADVGEIFRAVYLPGPNMIVLADDIGVHYAPWPASPSGPWTWKQVAMLQRGRYSGLAVGPNDTVAVAYWGVDLAIGFYGIVVLGLAQPDLVVRTRATIQGPDEKKMAYVSLTSSAADRNRMYAAPAGAGDDGSYLLGVLRSDDGGQTWRKAGTGVSTTLPYPHDLLQATGHQGNGWNNCIAASHVNPDVVLLGWCTSGAFLSTDGAKSWNLKHADQDSRHLHSDLHGVPFDATDPTGRSFYICSDGGIVRTSDLGDSLDSSLNSQLADLQFQREFGGYFHASPVAPGVVAGGLQDNGIAWAEVAQDEPWHLQISGGDGFRCVFLQTGQLVFTHNSHPAPQICDWKPVEMTNQRVIPVVTAKPGLPGNPDGLFDVFGSDPGHWYRNTMLSPVPKPSHRNARGYLMYALGSVYGDVYGLFAASNGSDAQWGYLGSVPIDVGAFEIRCLSAFHGDNVYVGTSDGRIFALDPRQGSVLELNVTTRVDDKTSIMRIATYDSYEDAFAIHGSNLLRLEGFAWQKVGGLPDESFFGVVVRSTSGDPTVFVTTDSRVYSSHDGARTWRVASNGLPERPHCGDLAIGPTFSGTEVLYVSTYGSSIWWSELK